ncbi:MAG: hypothetical protein US62_C0005G0018 [Candidatus Woesebacteria bacterium GW2011_GWA1_37_8]|uniref:Uncharacterized protein n=1 Tax=Candidatus Woesebacteria bacterium GW2011_GWA1_37_8 TaxID=1618546 RepID=A0A0G0I577_9BACT|nr:MAG: hypothetical protein US62_C0005G0018 [Candidatus Woesebacteria bacterium GW2011_GWA1_37_8]
MRAAIYNPYLDTLGGGERYTLSFAKVLLNNGFDVNIFWKDSSILDKFEKRFGITLNGLKTIDDIKKGEGYDLCFWVSDGSIPILHSRNNILHFQFPFQNVSGRSLLNKMKLYRINHIVVNSLFTKNFIDKEYGVNSEVIYPPVDVDKIRTLNKQNVILSVGRFSQLTQAKRQDVLISAFQKLVKKGIKNWKLILAGGTEVGAHEYIKSLKNMIKDLNIEIIESPDVKTLYSLYGKSKLFWSASGFEIDELKDPMKVEHFGISTVESMAGGCVPLVYNAGGHKETIQNEVNGYLWHNTNELVKKTVELINDKEKLQKLSEKTIEDCQKFSLLQFEKKIVSIL